jgi:hypothetical protein
VNLSLFPTAFGTAWSFVASFLARVPYLQTFLSFVSGPFGAIAAPIVKAITDAVSEIVKLLGAYVSLLLDAVTITLNNLKVLVLIFTAFAGGIAYGIYLDRSYLPTVKPPQTVQAALADLHKNFKCFKR